MATWQVPIICTKYISKTNFWQIKINLYTLSTEYKISSNNSELLQYESIIFNNDFKRKTN